MTRHTVPPAVSTYLQLYSLRTSDSNQSHEEKGLGTNPEQLGSQSLEL
jgi:hypothetical protein